eukprot:TRINITY_DN60845_c0_g1_i1.p1 TRINITY_DN60845_c0_g1~~TRINITY_DN60845_c0_g1_i1.p1  ORF type:complete len:554 (+),score=118.59 TRINITY_DN60845_c0_g1_i1:85-1746(+)
MPRLPSLPSQSSGGTASARGCSPSPSPRYGCRPNRVAPRTPSAAASANPTPSSSAGPLLDGLLAPDTPAAPAPAAAPAAAAGCARGASSGSSLSDNMRCYLAQYCRFQQSSSPSLSADCGMSPAPPQAPKAAQVRAPSWMDDDSADGAPPPAAPAPLWRLPPKQEMPATPPPPPRPSWHVPAPKGRAGVVVGSKGVRVRANQDLDAALLQELPASTRVVVAEVCGRRARIVSPVRGWVSLASASGQPLIKLEPEAAPPLTPPSPTPRTPPPPPNTAPPPSRTPPPLTPVMGTPRRPAPRSAAAATPCPPSAAAWRRARLPLARAAFDEFNAACFRSALPEIELVWAARLTRTAGRCVFKGGKARRWALIELSCKVLDSEERLRATLLHEMCHAAAWIIDGVSKPPHGAAFCRWARQAMAATGMRITVCHNYQVHRPIVYRCVECGHNYRRHSKSIDVARQRCGICRGHLELQGRFSAGGTPAKQRAASGFSLFVKEHIGQVIAGGTPRGEAMRVVAARWEATKKQQQRASGDSLTMTPPSRVLDVEGSDEDMC